MNKPILRLITYSFQVDNILYAEIQNYEGLVLTIKELLSNVSLESVLVVSISIRRCWAKKHFTTLVASHIYKPDTLDLFLIPKACDLRKTRGILQ